MATASIGGVSLSTFGLRLARLDGNVSMPPFKSIINEHDFPTGLQILDEQDIYIRLVGIYDSRPELGSAINAFYSQIGTAVKQEWIFSDHDFIATCVVKDGIKPQVYDDCIEMDITLTKTK